MSAIRALRQVALPLAARRTLCTAAAVPRVAGLRVAPRSLASVSVSRGFASSARRFGEGSSDVVLSQKLQEELNYEKETANASQEEPEFLRDFKAQGVWSVADTAGHDEVALSRKFGNENLRLIFSTADIQPAEEDYATEEGEESEPNSEEEYPIRVSLSITKSNGPGALNVDMVSQDGNFLVDNISFYEDSKIGTELTAESDWKRRGLYIGPHFDTLDVAVQDEFEAFLRERGIDQSLAHFIPLYAEYKEQREYVKWLTRVKSFVDL